VIVPQIAEIFHVTPQQQHSRCNNLELVGATSGQNELLLEQTDATTLDTTNTASTMGLRIQAQPSLMRAARFMVAVYDFDGLLEVDGDEQTYAEGGDVDEEAFPPCGLIHGEREHQA
jgi:hypothetical protein